MSGLIYLEAALAHGGDSLFHAFKLKVDPDFARPMRVFCSSIAYVMVLFAPLLVDHCFIIRLSF